MNPYFSDVKKNFGFGCMRLPMLNGEVDHMQMCAMVDTLQSGSPASVNCLWMLQRSLTNE